MKAKTIMITLLLSMATLGVGLGGVQAQGTAPYGDSSDLEAALAALQADLVACLTGGSASPGTDADPIDTPDQDACLKFAGDGVVLGHLTAVAGGATDYASQATACGEDVACPEPYSQGIGFDADGNGLTIDEMVIAIGLDDGPQACLDAAPATGRAVFLYVAGTTVCFWHGEGQAGSHLGALPVHHESADNRLTLAGLTIDRDDTEGDDSIDEGEGRDATLLISLPSEVSNTRAAPGQTSTAVFNDGYAIFVKDLYFGGNDLDADGDSDSFELICGSNPTNPASHCDDLDGDGKSVADGDQNDRDYRDQLDSDGDGEVDSVDNCPNIANPNQEDSFPVGAPDGVGDHCDDTDGDGILDYEELNGLSSTNTANTLGASHGYGPTDPTLVDTDGDGADDNVELGLNTAGEPINCGGGSSRYGTDPNTDDTVTDDDGDGLSNFDEIGTNGCYNNPNSGETHPDNVDTDSDGIDDGHEAAGELNDGTVHGWGATNGRKAGSDNTGNNQGDGDRANDLEEITGSLNSYCTPYNTVTAVGTSTLKNEVATNTTAECAQGAATSPFLTDSDGDGISDGEEMAGFASADGNTYVTDPNNPDTDGDGFTDSEETDTVSLPATCEAACQQDPRAEYTSPVDADDSPTSFEERNGLTPEQLTALAESTVENATSGPIATLISTLKLVSDTVNDTAQTDFYGIVIEGVMPECAGDDAPEFCNDPTDTRDLRDTNGNGETNEPNGQPDVLEERVLYTTDRTDAVLDLHVVTPRASLGAVPGDLARIIVGDIDAEDDRTDVLAFYSGGQAACAYTRAGHEADSEALHIGIADSLADACGGHGTVHTDYYVRQEAGGLQIHNAADHSILIGFELGDSVYDTVLHANGASSVIGEEAGLDNDENGWHTANTDPTTCEPVVGDPSAGEVGYECSERRYDAPGQGTPTTGDLAQEICGDAEADFPACAADQLPPAPPTDPEELAGYLQDQVGGLLPEECIEQGPASLCSTSDGRVEVNVLFVTVVLPP